MTQANSHHILRPVLAMLVLFLVLVQPNHPHAMTWGALFVFPLELPVILLGLMALRQGLISFLIRTCLTAALTLIAALKTADYISFSALSRGFNPVADLALINAFVRLISGTFGPLSALAAIVLAILALALLAWLIWWATGVWTRISPPPVWTGTSGAAAIFFCVIATIQVGHAMGRWSAIIDPPGTAFTARVGVERIVTVRTTLAQLRTFKDRAQNDAYAGVDGLLDIIDRDVLVIFVESYGRTSHDTEFYADLHRQTLTEYQESLSSLGLSMQSGYLAAPTSGGQSWLSHATFANGLWVDNQVRYAAALASGRQTLFHHAADNNFRTAAVMPQITLAWPESENMGFETVLVSHDLGYNGPAFNWVTMPDQFTLTALDRLLRSSDDERDLFAQVVLVSSHAPWVPVPEILDWDEIGDGRIFEEIAASGDTPETVWRDRDRVRAQYRLAVDYALRSVFEYAALHAADPPLMIVMGDHQAAEFVALDGRPDVPLHIIGPAPLVERLIDVAASPGLLPSIDAQVTPMDAMRDILLDAFSTTTSADPIH